MKSIITYILKTILYSPRPKNHGAKSIEVVNPNTGINKGIMQPRNTNSSERGAYKEQIPVRIV